MKNYCIEIINTNFELLGIITNFESLICVWNYYESGTFELTINKNKANTSKLAIGNILIVNKDDEKILLIDKVITTSNKNSKTIKASGTCIKGITKKRIIATNGYDRVDKTSAENIIKHYIKNHLVESYFDNIRTPERDISFIKIASTQNRGIETVWQARLTNLHDELKHISEDTGVGWKGILDRKNKCVILDCYVGKNRSIEQDSNKGNTYENLNQRLHSELENRTHEALEGDKKVPYIIFSENKRNLFEGKTTNDNTNYKNVGYIAGKGENEDRLISVIGESSGFQRNEVLIDLNNIDDPIELKQEGEKKLKAYNEIKSIEGKVYQIPNMEYGKDFFLGDIVTIENDGITESKRIIQVKEIYERNNISVELGFGDKVPSLAEQILKLTQKPIV